MDPLYCRPPPWLTGAVSIFFFSVFPSRAKIRCCWSPIVCCRRYFSVALCSSPQVLPTHFHAYFSTPIVMKRLSTPKPSSMKTTNCRWTKYYIFIIVFYILPPESSVHFVSISIHRTLAHPSNSPDLFSNSNQASLVAT